MCFGCRWQQAHSPWAQERLAAVQPAASTAPPAKSRELAGRPAERAMVACGGGGETGTRGWGVVWWGSVLLLRGAGRGTQAMCVLLLWIVVDRYCECADTLLPVISAGQSHVLVACVRHELSSSWRPWPQVAGYMSQGFDAFRSGSWQPRNALGARYG
jgi:hypothetical protein